MSFTHGNFNFSPDHSQEPKLEERKKAQVILDKFLQLRGSALPEQWQPTETDWNNLYKQVERDFKDSALVRINGIQNLDTPSAGINDGMKVAQVAIISISSGKTLAEISIFVPPNKISDSPV